MRGLVNTFRTPKTGSYPTANAWWRAKQAEIHGRQPPHPHAEYLDSLARRRDWAIRHDHSAVEALWAEIAHVERGGLPGFLIGTAFDPEPPSIDDPPPPDAYQDEDDPPDEVIAESYWRGEVARAIDPLDEVWNDRVANDRPEAVPDDRTVGTQLIKYMNIELSRALAESNPLSPSQYDQIRLCLNAFRDWINPATPIDRLDADTWESWWTHLLGWTGSIDYKKKRLSHARSFIEWLASKGAIPLPQNLNKRKYRFGSSIRAVRTMTISEVRTLIDNASGQQISSLLMLNCGMQQKDIAYLTHSDVDWTRGRIVRKRTKTRDVSACVPMVDYKLWPQTWELLQEFRNVCGDHVLLTRSGGLWLTDTIDADGKRRKADNIASLYHHLIKKINAGKDESVAFKKPLKLIRKTSATLIESHEHYGRYKSRAFSSNHLRNQLRGTVWRVVRHHHRVAGASIRLHARRMILAVSIVAIQHVTTAQLYRGTRAASRRGEARDGRNGPHTPPSLSDRV